MKTERSRAHRLKVELFALYLAARHPETPWYAKLVVAGFVAYAVTPVDLVPDLILVPLAGARTGRRPAVPLGGDRGGLGVAGGRGDGVCPHMTPAC